MITGKQIAETVREAYECKGGYIMGQMGATWTAAKQANMEKAYKADPEKNAKYKSSVQYGSQWIGHRVWDCAGLPRWAAKEHGLAIHSGSNLIWNCDLAKRGALTAGMDLPVGALVFTGETESDHPHVGDYTGDGIVTEATGAKKGVIESKLSDKKWRWWGMLKGVTYEFIPGTADAPKTEVPKTETGSTPPTIRKGNKNVYVKQMQQILDKLGYNLGICGVDSDFGTATEKALKEFQRDHQLEQDGVCGPRTWAALKEAEAKLSEKPAEERYTVTIKGLTKGQAEELCKTWKEATMKKE